MGQLRKLTVRLHGTKVFAIFNDDRFSAVEMDWRKAEEVGRAFIAQARKAEEQEKGLAIAKDNAVLLRAGVPLSLSNDKRILDESATIAAHDRGLRRFMPGGVKSQEHFGVPSIVHGRPARGAK